MSGADRPGRESDGPLLDDLGKEIVAGKDAVAYLWNVPDDEDTREKVRRLLQSIRSRSAKKGRREMPQVCAELLEALEASPTPQQVDLLQSGFDRLYRLWSAAKSGLM
ncbi:MAG: hypothetical protein PVF27_01430 [Gemmatimonadales bacterium]|jgi:hypothetical protein